MSLFFTSCGQNIEASALTSVLPMNTQDGFPLGWTGWISLQSKGPSKVFSNTIGSALGITDKMEAQSPAPSPHSAVTDPGMKELGLVILTCLFLCSAELTEKEY